MTDQQSIRDAYWARTLWKRRSLSARFTKVLAWFAFLPIVRWWLVRPILGGGWSAVALSLLLAAALLAVTLLTGRAKHIATRRLIHARTKQYRICPCGYALEGSPREGVCPECGKDYSPQSLKEHWEGGTHEHVAEESWRPIGERRMWRALTWWQLASIIAVPVVFFLARELFPRAGVVVVTVFLAAVVSLLLYITRGYVFEWRTLTRQRSAAAPVASARSRTRPTPAHARSAASSTLPTGSNARGRSSTESPACSRHGPQNQARHHDKGLRLSQ